MGMFHVFKIYFELLHQGLTHISVVSTQSAIKSRSHWKIPQNGDERHCHHRPLAANKKAQASYLCLHICPNYLLLHHNRFCDFHCPQYRIWHHGCSCNKLSCRWTPERLPFSCFVSLRGSEEIVIRDFLIAASFAAFNGGSLKIAAGCHPSHTSCDINMPGHMWTGIISAVIFTTMQVQDLKDRVGDRLRGRKTVVLFLGERVSRGSIAFFVVFWSLVCSHFWQLELWRASAPIPLSIIIAYQVTMGTHHQGDWHSWYLWSLWLILLYSLPVISGV